MFFEDYFMRFCKSRATGFSLALLMFFASTGIASQERRVEDVLPSDTYCSSLANYASLALNQKGQGQDKIRSHNRALKLVKKSEDFQNISTDLKEIFLRIISSAYNLAWSGRIDSMSLTDIRMECIAEANAISPQIDSDVLYCANKAKQQSEGRASLYYECLQERGFSNQ